MFQDKHGVYYTINGWDPNCGIFINNKKDTAYYWMYQAEVDTNYENLSDNQKPGDAAVAYALIKTFGKLEVGIRLQKDISKEFFPIVHWGEILE